MNHKLKIGIILLIMLNQTHITFVRAGSVQMTTSDNGNATLSSDGLAILAKDTETVKLEATCNNGTVAVTYSPSSALTQQSDTGSGTADQQTVFSISTPAAVYVDNTIAASLAHTGNNGDVCLPGGKSVTFHVFVPQLVFDVTSWTTGSTGDSSIAAFGTAAFGTASPPIGLTSGQPQYETAGQGSGDEGIPYEYQVSVAPSVSTYTSFSNNSLGVQEVASYTITTNPGNHVVSGPNTSSPVQYNDGNHYFNVGGTSTNPIAYAIDCPSVPPLILGAYFGSGVTSVTITLTLQSSPTYKGKVVGKTVTHTFSITATPNPTSGYTTYTGTD